MRLTHAIYLVTDLERAIDFLTQVLGFSLVLDDMTHSGDRFLTMGSGQDSVDLQVVVCEQQPEIAALKRDAGVVDFILQTNDIDSLVADVRSAGLTIVQPLVATAYGVTGIFEDPFGNRWDVVQRPAVV
jgi:uncharacterized glyoxalase superfamily protein PhnB